MKGYSVPERQHARQHSPSAKQRASENNDMEGSLPELSRKKIKGA